MSIEPELAIHHDHIILDACCVINLLASEFAKDIVDALPVQAVVARHILRREVLGHDAADLATVDRLILEEDVTEIEAVDIVNFAAILGGDGEAFTGALAVHRNWAIGCDEKRVIKFFTGIAPNIQIVTTPELIKNWAFRTGRDRQMICRVINNIERIGRFRVGAKHPCFAWWQSYTVNEAEETNGR